MQIIRHINRCPAFPHPVLSLGNFDGVHIGHQAILRQLVAEARSRQGTAIVLTFHPHPVTVLHPQKPLPLICSVREKLTAFRALDVDKVILQRFTPSFAQCTPEEFVQKFVIETIGAEKVIVGLNVSFGRNRAGSAAMLEQFGHRYGFAVEVVGPINAHGAAVSSTAVRALLSRGDMPLVTRALGRFYAISGRVLKGFQRGRTIGFPTANLRPRTDLLLPNGVYAVRVEVDGRLIAGVANIGVNPTFGLERKTLEAHLFDFTGDLYGRRITVNFVEHLRGEQKFPSLEDLKKQIQEDAVRARVLLLGVQP